MVVGNGQGDSNGLEGLTKQQLMEIILGGRREKNETYVRVIRRG